MQKEKKRTQYFAEVKIQSPDQKICIPMKYQLDSGATCSTMHIMDYYKLTDKPPPPSYTKLRLYDKSVIKPVGAIGLYCTANNIKKKIHFEIVENAHTSLLSGNACEALNLMQFNQECLINVVSVSPNMTKEQVLSTYKDVFTGHGKLPGVYHIDIDDNVKPVQNTRRRVAAPLKEELRNKLNELEESGVMSKVSEPTPWISSMVAVRKPNKLRICLDPTHLNKAINRNHYPIPTIDDVMPRLAKAKIFSVADAKDGYLQVELDEPSSKLTTFWTPFGRYRWLRMPFGICSAPEEFQRRLDECLEGLNNVEVIADDIIIYGTGDTADEAVESHDASLKALLERCRERGLKLNKSSNWKV